MGQKEKFKHITLGNYTLALTSESSIKYFALSPCAVHESLLRNKDQLLQVCNYSFTAFSSITSKYSSQSISKINT